MANRKQRRHPAKRQGMNFADELQRQRMVKELAAEAAKDKMVKVQTEIRTQKTLWLAYVALNDEFQFGADRIERFAQQLMVRSEWFEKISQEDGDDVADEKLRRENIVGKEAANRTHYEVGKKVRQTIKELGGTMPEDLPTPNKSIKQIESEQKKLGE